MYFYMGLQGKSKRGVELEGGAKNVGKEMGRERGRGFNVHIEYILSSAN